MKCKEAALFKNKVKEEDSVYSDEEDNGIDEEHHKIKAEKAKEVPNAENVMVEPCNDQDKELLR